MKKSKDVAMDIDVLISSIEDITASVVHDIPEGYQGTCPAHDDTNKSLRILENGEGRYEVSCISGCSNLAIMEKLGFSPQRKQVTQAPILTKEKGKIGVRVVGLNDFLNMDLPKKEMILSPFLTTQGIVLVYAKR